MSQILGHNFIGGQRAAAGTIIVKSVDASTGDQPALQFPPGHF